MPSNNLEIFTQLFNLFMLLWGLFFLSALEELVMAGAFSAWYWTFNKKDDLPTVPLSLSVWRAFRYHLGTLAFGSLIIAIIRFIRIMIEFVEERLKEYSQDNPIVKVYHTCNYTGHPFMVRTWLRECCRQIEQRW